jgi:CheY-like chemotaxis protein
MDGYTVWLICHMPSTTRRTLLAASLTILYLGCLTIDRVFAPVDSAGIFALGPIIALGSTLLYGYVGLAAVAAGSCAAFVLIPGVSVIMLGAYVLVAALIAYFRTQKHTLIPARCTASTHHNILVVDNHVPSARGLRMLLERTGHRVRLAHDGTTALAIARSEHPGLVILDASLPDISPSTLMSDIRAAGIEATFVTLSDTAPVSTDTEQLLLKKPVGIADLERLVARIA